MVPNLPCKCQNGPQSGRQMEVIRKLNNQAFYYNRTYLIDTFNQMLSPPELLSFEPVHGRGLTKAESDWNICYRRLLKIAAIKQPVNDDFLSPMKKKCSFLRRTRSVCSHIRARCLAVPNRHTLSNTHCRNRLAALCRLFRFNLLIIWNSKIAAASFKGKSQTL